MKTAGLTGCQAGWLLISLDDRSSVYRFLEGSSLLEEQFELFDRLLVNIPIGLHEERYGRTCDRLLRERLGDGLREEVVEPPSRLSLNAPTYVEANMQSFEITGETLSLKSWTLTPGIRTLDGLLRREERWKKRVLESHPELILSRLNGQVIFQKKGTRKGLRHRLDLIAGEAPVFGDFFREIKEKYRRNEIEEVDIVHAGALALAARLSAEQPLRTLPDPPETDSFGLPMAIHYV